MCNAWLVSPAVDGPLFRLGICRPMAAQPRDREPLARAGATPYCYRSSPNSIFQRLNWSLQVTVHDRARKKGCCRNRRPCAPRNSPTTKHDHSFQRIPHHHAGQVVPEPAVRALQIPMASLPRASFGASFGFTGLPTPAGTPVAEDASLRAQQSSASSASSQSAAGELPEVPECLVAPFKRTLLPRAGIWAETAVAPTPSPSPGPVDAGNEPAVLPAAPPLHTAAALSPE